MVEEEVLAVESEAGYTQNVYKVSLRLRINKNRGGDMTDILNEIRDADPIRYTKVKLAPGIRRIKGVDIQQIQSSPQKIS